MDHECGRVFDSFGNIVDETHYDTSGSTVTAGQPGFVDQAFAFTGRYFDADTGLQNNLNRWYDALVGRWLSEDPIGFAGDDDNLHRYVGNAPTMFVDPTGNESSSFPGGIIMPSPVAQPTPPSTRVVLPIFNRGPKRRGFGAGWGFGQPGDQAVGVFMNPSPNVIGSSVMLSGGGVCNTIDGSHGTSRGGTTMGGAFKLNLNDTVLPPGAYLVCMTVDYKTIQDSRYAGVTLTIQDGNGNPLLEHPSTNGLTQKSCPFAVEADPARSNFLDVWYTMRNHASNTTTICSVFVTIGRVTGFVLNPILGFPTLLPIAVSSK